MQNKVKSIFLKLVCLIFIFIPLSANGGNGFSCCKPLLNEEATQGINSSPSAQDPIENGTMIVGARYSQLCYKAYKGLRVFTLVDIKSDCDLIHDIKNPFPERYKNKYATVVFEQLPNTEITQQSIDNALAVLKGGGQLVMNYPRLLGKMNFELSQQQLPLPLYANGKKFYPIGSLYLFINDSSITEAYCSNPYNEGDLEGVYKELASQIFSTYASQLSVRAWNKEEMQSRLWFKNEKPSPTYLLIIKKP